MEFIQHTINWTKGEIFEAVFIGAFGLLLVICGVLFWRLGQTPNAKSMFIPLVLVGILFAGAGMSGVVSNQKRIPKFEQEFHENPTVFVENEKERVEDFQYLYTMTLILASVSFVIAMTFFWFTNSSVLKAIGIALLIFGLSGIVIDYFSKERADIYYEQILEQI